MGVLFWGGGKVLVCFGFLDGVGSRDENDLVWGHWNKLYIKVNRTIFLFFV